MGQLFSSNKNDYTSPIPPENRGIFTGSSNFSYTSSAIYTQPSVQTATKESKPKIAVSSSSSSGTFSYAPRSTYLQPNIQATPSTTRDYPGNTILTQYDNVSSIVGTTKDKYSATSDTIKKAYGYYRCSCGAWWESAHSWAHETQEHL